MLFDFTWRKLHFGVKKRYGKVNTKSICIALLPKTYIGTLELNINYEAVALIVCMAYIPLSMLTEN